MKRLDEQEEEYQAAGAGGIIDEMYEGMSKISMKELNTQV